MQHLDINIIKVLSRDVNQDKDLSSKDKDLTHQDKDLTPKDKDLKYVLKDEDKYHG